jgi:hypothetical protein
MAAIHNHTAEDQTAHREAMRQLVEEQAARMGISFDPTATREKVRAMMRACGVRPEDNVFSRDIIQSRYPDEEQE